MTYFITFLLAITIILFLTRKKRELKIGNLIYHKKIINDKTIVISEKLRFKNSMDCIKNYNHLVFEFSRNNSKYNLDSWTYNKFEYSDSKIELFRFGNYIKLVKTIQK